MQTTIQVFIGAFLALVIALLIFKPKKEIKVYWLKLNEKKNTPRKKSKRILERRS